MKKYSKYILSLALLPLVPACQEKPDQAKADDSSKETVERLHEQNLLARGDQASKALMSSLGTKLKAALKAQGPVHGLNICQQLAQPSTGEVSDQFEGLAISRVSLKPRNPKNAPSELDKEMLAGWQKELAAGRIPEDEIQQNDGEPAVFYRPIMTQDVCLKCHGDPSTFSKELSDSLAKLYPKDMATGYKSGELRGAFRVAFEDAKK